MRKSFVKIGLIIVFLVLSGVGCINIQTGPKEGDGGVWKTSDKGDHWISKKNWLTSGGIRSISGTNIVTMAMDPEDRNAIYIGTADNGLFYSYDGGESWFSASGLSSGRVTSVSVDAHDKCTIFATMGQRVWKSTDCNRTYSPVYFDGRSDVSMTSVSVDWYNQNTIYVGDSAGDLLKSTDGGANWATIQRFENAIKKIYIDPIDSRLVYVGFQDAGIRKSADAGASWTDLTPGLSNFDNGRGFVTIVGDSSAQGSLLVATNYGLLRSTDAGASWQSINLTTPPGGVTIYSLAMNPINGNEIYYATGSTFYRSINGGANWTTKKLPTNRAATYLMVDPQDANMIYMGTTQLRR